MGRPVTIARLLSEIISVLILLGGCVVLMGWAFDIPVLKSVYPGLVTMKANAAICFVLIGMALWCLQTKRSDNAGFRLLAAWCAVVVLLMGLAVFCEYVFHWDLGLDQLLFKESWGAVLTSSPGRMAFNTAINFVLVGLSLLFLSGKRVRSIYVIQFLVLVVGLISLLSLIGYCYGASPLYIGQEFSTAMAIHTTILFILACVGILFSRPDMGLIAQTTCDFTGGRVLRRFLPIAIIVPISLGFFKIFAQRANWFSNEFGVSLVAFGNLFVITVYIYFLSVLLNRSDIKRKTEEEKSKNSRKFLQKIIDLLPVRIFWKDKDLRYMGCNEILAKDAGKNRPEDLIGKDDFQMGWKEQAKIYQDDDRIVIKSGKAKLNFEEPQTTPQGDEIWIKTSKMPLTDLDGNLIGILGVYEDITERKRAEKDLGLTQAQLVQSEKLASIGQLAAGVAHEVNNPIGFISNNLEMLAVYIDDYTKILMMYDELMTTIQQGDVEKSKTVVEEIKTFSKDINLEYIINDLRKLFEQTQKGIERVQKIVKDLRTFAREDVNATDLIKVEEVIDSVLSIVYNEIKYKADLKKNYTDTPMIKGNPQGLGQVFINLLVNAVQAIDDKGVVEIKTYVQDRNVCVDIRDTGKGIKSEHLRRIFDPFFTTKPVGQGTGLGLSVSYEIVKKHGGEIKAQSKEGEGATFTVLLPIP